MDAGAAPSLTMKRRFRASPQRLWQAWTDPELLLRWFGPENVTAQEAHADLRPGGRYRIVMLGDDGERHEVSGEYAEVVEPERLVFSWAWITTPDRVSRVTVSFRPDGDETILTLLHEQFADAAAAGRHVHGWSGSLDKLAAWLG